MTYKEFKEELENLVLCYAEENEASLEIDVKVEKDVKYLSSSSRIPSSIEYAANITTTIINK